MLKIILDSTCGLTKKEALAKGYGYLPMSVIVENKKYVEGVNIEQKDIIKALKEGKKITTSQPSIGVVEEVLKKEAKNNDKVIVLTISDKLSGTFKNVETVAKKLDNVFVVDTKNGGPCILALAEFVIKSIKKMDIPTLLVELNEKINSAVTFFIPKTLDALKKSGRIKPAVAAMANFIGITPILKIDQGAVTKFGKTRNQVKGFRKALSYFDDVKDKINSVFLLSAGIDKDLKKELVAIVKEELGLEVIITSLPSAVTTHVGIGTIGLSSGYFI